MKINRRVLGLAVVAGVAFVVGRSDLLRDGESIATAEPRQDEGMTPKMEAMMKAGMPGAHHAYLQQMVGDWEGSFKMWESPGAPPMEMPGTITREWILDGHYLAETVTSTSDWGTFKGMGFLGYSNIDGEYQGIWMDTQSTSIMWSAGSYNPETKVFTMTGTYRDPLTGHVLRSRGVLNLTSPDRHTMIEYRTGQDGKETKVFEGVMERKSKAAGVGR